MSQHARENIAHTWKVRAQFGDPARRRRRHRCLIHDDDVGGMFTATVQRHPAASCAQTCLQIESLHSTHCTLNIIHPQQTASVSRTKPRAPVQLYPYVLGDFRFEIMPFQSHRFVRRTCCAPVVAAAAADAKPAAQLCRNFHLSSSFPPLSMCVCDCVRRQNVFAMKCGAESESLFRKLTRACGRRAAASRRVAHGEWVEGDERASGFAGAPADNV